jgi:hypothetical protein
MSHCLSVTLLTSLFGVVVIPSSQAQLPDLSVSETIEQIESYRNDLIFSEAQLEQITSVTNLSDVRPTDWAFSALQGLVERYSCITGYPDQTFRGNQTLTRYEFATALSACLSQIEVILGNKTSERQISGDDFAVIERLRTNFETELIVLRDRADELDIRLTQLEDNLFSTTTKLNGVANFVLTDILSGEGEDNAVFQQRVRLAFLTSFSGRDLLVTRIATGNATIPDVAGGTSEVVQTHQWYGGFNNDFFLVTLYYLTPLTDKLVALFTPVGGLHADYGFPPVNPYFEDFDAGTTTLSTFAQRNQIYSLGGGSGLALVYQLSDTLSLGGAYYPGQGFSPQPEQGLFDGTYTAGAQLKWQASDQLGLSLGYIRGYFTEGQFGFGDNSRAFGLPFYAGTAVVNETLSQFQTTTNSYGADFFLQINPEVGIGGWVGFIDAEVNNVGNGEIWNYALTFAFPDLGKEGNLGGLILGAQPYLANLEGVDNFSDDIPFHIEGFYRYHITENISLTPGFIWLTAPNQNADNEDVVIGTLRTTFTF